MRAQPGPEQYKGLHALSLDTVCFLKHCGDMMGSVGRLLFQSIITESMQATSLVSVARSEYFIASNLFTSGRERKEVELYLRDLSIRRL